MAAQQEKSSSVRNVFLRGEFSYFDELKAIIGCQELPISAVYWGELWMYFKRILLMRLVFNTSIKWLHATERMKTIKVDLADNAAGWNDVSCVWRTGSGFRRMDSLFYLHFDKLAISLTMNNSPPFKRVRKTLDMWWDLVGKFVRHTLSIAGHHHFASRVTTPTTNEST